VTAHRQGELEVGLWVALTLKPGAAPRRVYIGLVEAVGRHGIRLSRLEWLGVSLGGCHLFVPWESITAALVVMNAEAAMGLSETAERWQKQIAGGSA
jgi:hypothetical protein